MYQRKKEENLELNSREASEGRTELESLPISLYVDINLKCNLRCPHCHRADPRQGGKLWPTLDYSTFEKVARALFPTAYRVNLSGGGESLIHRDFDRMLETCLHYETYPVLYTNGSALNRKRAVLLARSGTYLGISMDGASRQTFERTRYPAKWKRMLKSLELIRQVRRDVGNPDFFPYLQVVIQRENVGELPAFVDLARQFELELVKFANLYPHFDELHEMVADAESAAASLAGALKRANRAGIRLEIPDYGETSVSSLIAALREENASFPTSLDKSRSGRYVSGGFVKYPDFRSIRCGIPWSESMITPEGKVVVGCCSQYQLGDLAEKSFTEIWNDRGYRELRRTVNSNEPMFFCRPRHICPFRL
mgnify:CR=1 FL=1